MNKAFILKVIKKIKWHKEKIDYHKSEIDRLDGMVLSGSPEKLRDLFI